jgi:hypothetical protein
MENRAEQGMTKLTDQDPKDLKDQDLTEQEENDLRDQPAKPATAT